MYQKFIWFSQEKTNQNILYYTCIACSDMPLTDGLHDPLGGWFSVADCSCTDLKKKKRELEDFLEDGDIDGWPRI